MKANTKKTDGIIDLDFSAIQKKKFRINGDDSKILELNTSDTSILTRLPEAMPKLEQKQAEIQEDMPESISRDSMEYTLEMSKKFNKVDIEMKELVDYIFDAPVSSVLANDGSMFDIFNGVTRFEYIINILLAQYEDNLSKEFDGMDKKMKAHLTAYNKG